MSFTPANKIQESNKTGFTSASDILIAKSQQPEQDIQPTLKDKLSEKIGTLTPKRKNTLSLTEKPTIQTPEKGVFTGREESPFQFTSDDGAIKTIVKTIGNTPSSLIGLGKNVYEAVSHPVDTVKSVVDVTKGAGAKVGQTFLEDTDIGQALLRGAKDKGVDLPIDANGKIKTKDTPELEKFNQVANFFKDRYGSVDKFKETAVEDPAGVLADLASIFTGGGSAITKVGELSKASKVADIGNALSKVGEAVEPVNTTANVVKKTQSAIVNSTAGKIVSDISPTSYKVQQGQVAKALELTPGDLSSINKKTGNDVTDYIINNNLIKDSPEEIANALNDKRKATMDEVRGEIKNVKAVYSPEQVPNLKKGLDVILQGIKDVPGLEKEAADVQSLAQKTSYTLSDVQKAKELMDEHSNIYSKMGDVKSSSQAKGLDNIRKNLKGFIEDEVELNTNGQVSIKNLNNDVQTTYAIEDAIKNRAMKGMSRQHLSAFDALIGVGGYSINPLLGVGLVVGKKILESPTARLTIAKTLNKLSPSRAAKFAKEIVSKNLSDESKSVLQEIADKLKTYTPAIESSSNALEESQIDNTQD